MSFKFNFRWADDRMAKAYAKNRKMKRKVKFGFSLVAAVIQYCFEKSNGKPVMSKREFVRTFYKQYLELNNTTQNSDQGNSRPHSTFLLKMQLLKS
jgi:hypothetical protein